MRVSLTFHFNGNFVRFMYQKQPLSIVNFKPDSIFPTFTVLI